MSQFVALLVVASLFQACGQTQTNEDEDSIPIQVLQREFVIPGDGPHAAGNPVDAAFGPDKSIYVVDRGTSSIKHYDSLGLFLDEFGRSGEGPGEFRSPSSIAVSANGSIAVADDKLERITIWRTGKTDLLIVPSVTIGPGSLTWGRSSQLFARSLTNDGLGVRWSLQELDSSTGTMREVYSEVTNSNLLSEGELSASFCAVCPSAISSRGFLAVAPQPSARYRVNIRNADRLTSVERDIEFANFSSEEWKERQDAYNRMPARIRAAQVLVPHKPAVANVAFDDRGDLWVESARDTGAIVNIYASDGHLTDRLSLQHVRTFLDVKSDKALALEATPDGFVQVVKFRRLSSPTASMKKND
jgi:hypothetical protein